jgi:hypothetical protein
MSGFSIGWALSILNVALGLTLTALTTHYHRQILFVTLVGFLMDYREGNILPLHALHTLSKQPVPVPHRTNLLDIGIKSQERTNQEQAVTWGIENAVL